MVGKLGALTSRQDMTLGSKVTLEVGVGLAIRDNAQIRRFSITSIGAHLGINIYGDYSLSNQGGKREGTCIPANLKDPFHSLFSCGRRLSS